MDCVLNILYRLIRNERNEIIVTRHLCDYIRFIISLVQNIDGFWNGGASTTTECTDVMCLKIAKNRDFNLKLKLNVYLRTIDAKDTTISSHSPP